MPINKFTNPAAEEAKVKSNNSEVIYTNDGTEKPKNVLSKPGRYKLHSSSYLRDNENVISELVENIDAVFWIFSGNKLQYVSTAYEKLFGKSLYSIYKNYSSFLDCVYKDDLPDLLETIKKHNFMQGGNLTVEFRIIRSNNEIIWIEAHAFPINNCSDDLRIAGILEDVTYRKVFKEKVQKSMRDANQLNGLKSHFVSMVSHEFRSPLTTIQSSVEILELFNDKLSSQEGKDHFKKIYSSINYLSELLDDVITLSRVDSQIINPNFEKLEIVNYSLKIIDQVKSNFQIAPHIKFTPLSEELEVLTDKKLYNQILSNLLSNAIKYTPPDKEVLITISESKENFMFEIQDEGIGIPSEAQDKIFMPFSRASNTDNIAGTGLGLAIVHQSVKILKGSIDFKSKINEGTTFRVFLPKNNITK